MRAIEAFECLLPQAAPTGPRRVLHEHRLCSAGAFELPRQPSRRRPCVRESNHLHRLQGGPPEGTDNCDEGGCDRCLNREKYWRARPTIAASVSTQSKTLFWRPPDTGSRSRTRLCTQRCSPALDVPRSCSKLRSPKVFYVKTWPPPSSLVGQYETLQGAVPDGTSRLEVPDPYQSEAAQRQLPDSGHTIE